LVSEQYGFQNARCNNKIKIYDFGMTLYQGS
jgi:hypothetical protein